MDRNNICFFPFSRKLSVFFTTLKYKSSGLQIDLSHSFDMRVLNMSWPWNLLGSRFWINVAISSLVKATVEINSSIFLQRLKGSSLELFIMEHCLAKKQLKNSVFFLKSVTYLFCWKRGGIHGIFLLFNNDFNIDQ